MDPKQLFLLKEGTVIPAHPLSLTEDRKLHEKYQRALTRYYIAAGAGGIAVGVHTTQFGIRDPRIRLYEPVLRMAAEEVSRANLSRPFLKIAGVCGNLAQAMEEAEVAREYGYDMVLLSMGGLPDYSEARLLDRTSRISEILPVFGFYLQPSVGGRVLTFDFWKEFAELPKVYAIKVAPFNRYRTLDVVRAVCHSSRRDAIALYTGNDDNIVQDLLTVFRFTVDGMPVEKRFVGGLLGHWAFWTKKAVEMLDEIKALGDNPVLSIRWLTRNAQVTDANGVVFDAAHDFRGCIPGIHEILRRQGLMENIICLDPGETLSPGQSKEIERILRDYPHLQDNSFVQECLHQWTE